MEDKAQYGQLIRYISSLSAEERETFKDLIDEALQRDEQLTEYFRQTKRNAERFEESIRNMMEAVGEAQIGISRIYENLSEIKETSDAVSRSPLNDGPCLN